MVGDFGDDAITKLGVLGALSREYASDELAFFGFLASALQSSLGNSVVIETKGGFLTKKQIVSVVVSFGDDRYSLEDHAGSLVAKVIHVVRGIALKTDVVDVASWLTIVSEVVEQRANEHSESRKALQTLLGLD